MSRLPCLVVGPSHPRPARIARLAEIALAARPAQIARIGWSTRNTSDRIALREQLARRERDHS
jgi:hypothetical protein